MGASIQPRGGGGGRGRRARHRPMSEINVTPFVDVMLVLLIIFMVAAPLLTVGVPGELPKTAAAALPQDTEEPLTVTITAEGLVQIQTTDVPMDELTNRLRAIATERADDRIFLRADKAVDYGHFMEIMSLLRDAGYLKIALVGLENAAAASQPATVGQPAAPGTAP